MGEVIALGERCRGGPRTDAGKRRSSRNAMKTGVFAEAIVIRGVESQDAFDTLVKSVVGFHDIEDPVTLLAAERFIAIAWRLRRVRRIETEKLTEKGRQYVAASEDLQARHRFLEILNGYRRAVSDVSSVGTLEIETIDNAVNGVQYVLHYVLGLIDWKANCVEGQVCFEAPRLERILDRGKRVRGKTARAAFDDARLLLPDVFDKQKNVEEFLWRMYRALDEIVDAQRSEIDEHERKALRAFVDAMELDWQDERSLSNAERRLDAQFSRALADFHAARRAVAEDAADVHAKRRGAQVANQ